MPVASGCAFSGLLAATILAAACSGTPAKSPAQARADAATADRVYAALNDDPIFFFRHVDVNVDDGVARLSGFVWTTDALYRAEQIARNVRGVICVEDRMELARPAFRGGGG